MPSRHSTLMPPGLKPTIRPPLQPHSNPATRRDPPAVGSGREFRRWLCGVHNRVNSRLGKPVFNCDLVEARWAPLGCSAEEAAAGEPAAAGAGKGCELLGVGAKGGR